MRARSTLVAALVCTFALVAACGAGPEVTASGPSNDAGGSSGAASGSGGIGSGDGGSGGKSDAGYEQCATNTLAATRDALRVAVALDKSNSLCQRPADAGADCAQPDSLRAAVWNAMKAFFESPSSAGVQASLVGFAGGTCSNSLPATPAQPVDLPDVGHLLATALDSPAFEHESGTQTMAGVASARRFLRQQPDADQRKSAVLLVTDGLPTKCPDNDTSGLALAIQQITQTKNVGIPVYVIGVASYRNDEGSLGQLDDMAAAAGTNGNHAVRIDQGTPAEVTANLLAALDKIRNVELSCEVPLPVPPDGKTLDPNQVNVQVTTSGGVVDATQTVGCADPSGWQYEQNDAGVTKIVLCPALCESSKAVSATLNVILGCETRKSSPN